MSTSGVSSATTTTPGTNVPPVSFPGIVSGIDYDSIINELTSLTTAPEAQLNAQISTLNAANAELVKINTMLQSVQDALENLSDPDLFDTYDAISGDTSYATAQGITGQAATPGTYTIDDTQLATATQITSAAGAGETMLDTQNGGPSWQTTALADSYASVQPSNGTSGTGKITFDGVTVNYDVTTQSLQTIFGNINAALHAAGDTSFNIGFEAGTDVVQVTDDNALTIGSAQDQGNLLQVLKLDQAQLVTGDSGSSITGTSGVGGVSDTADFDSTTNAGFVTPVTAGTFTINGVQLTVSSDQNLADVITEINQSAAGVTAQYDTETGQITLTSDATGPQSIVLGSSLDTSNFLTAAGLTTASGATTVAGKQAVVVMQTPSGGTTTVYSDSNTVTTAIPGISLTLTGNDGNADGTGGTPFNVQVTQDTSQLVSALNAFVSAYNAAMTEIDNATAAPVVTSSQPGTSDDSDSFGGGVLYGRADISQLQSELTDMVSGFLGDDTSSINSLSQIGLSLSDTFQQVTSGNNAQSSSDDDDSSGITMTTYEGTDGTLQSLDVSQLTSALQTDPSGVQALLQGSNGLAYQLGGYLYGVTDTPTILDSGIPGTAPSTSLIQGFEDQISAQVTSLRAQVEQIQDSANMQADMLRSEFTDSESAIAGYQVLQQEISAEFGDSSSSSSSES